MSTVTNILCITLPILALIVGMAALIDSRRRYKSISIVPGHFKVIFINLIIVSCLLAVEVIIQAKHNFGIVGLGLSLPFMLYGTYRYFAYVSEHKSTTIIPDKTLPDLEIYEVGALYRGTITDEVILATAIHYKLNTEPASSQTELELIRLLEVVDIHQLANTVLHKSNSGRDYRKIVSILTGVMYKDLIRDGFFVFNSRVVTNSMVALGSLVFWLFAFLSQKTDLYEFPGSLIVWVLYFIGFGGILIGIYAPLASQNYSLTGDTLRMIAGFRMYLITTDYYKIKYDRELFEKFLPLMIVLGVHTDKLDDMLAYIKNRH